MRDSAIGDFAMDGSAMLPGMSSQTEFRAAILTIPLEIRREIYSYAWTVHERVWWEISCVPNLYEKEQYLFKSLRLQLLRLASICQQMRCEVLSEFFYKTQIRVRTHRFFFSSSVTKRIRDSAFFTSHTRHVGLVIDARGGNQIIESLPWLFRLKHLKTLDLLITLDWWYNEYCRSEDITKIINRIFGPAELEKLATLRDMDLERVTIRFVGPDDHNGKPNTDVAEGTTAFQKVKDVLSQTIREDLRQSRRQPAHRIENHIGVLPFDDMWEASDSD
ncbi:hypothetical protein B0T20DRAFT_477212 [Sordaria brevicollis]|uniref:Uncharacterized protein n=1 Tax=Sordaria brevicollis TaxID=83679 RepID=A0AAE0PJR0_SORBR|nr:hypothetical protein B0T20DRAFT_477212 [Sordaria brevicollis]